MKNIFTIGFVFCLLITACSDDNGILDNIDEHDCVENCVIDDEIHNTNSKIWQTDGETFLYGGLEEHMHFNASAWNFVPQNLHFGLGRETIQAPLNPSFSPIKNDNQFPQEEPCVVIRGADEVKIYPLAIMRRHEVVNDVINGEPVFVAYCLLADYVSVLSRTYCGHELTFGVSGWTYAEEGIWDGLQGFVLWDRDTQSLWWPLINKGVAGLMRDIQLEEFNPTKWRVMEWSKAISLYPEAVVLNSAQDHKVPTSWPSIEREALNCL